MRRLLADRHLLLVLAAGITLGLFGVLLSRWGNPERTGICVSCFLENTAGALGLHNNVRLQYIRPELPGFILGATVSALIAGEFRSRGGAAPLYRFLAGVFLIVGCSVFIGCPIKLFLRMTAGDLTTLAGFAGLLAGGWLAVRGLTAGVHIGRSAPQQGGSGTLVPLLFLFLLILLFVQPLFLLISTRGSAAEHAPLLVSLGVGLLLGVLAQRTRFCITGAIRDLFLLGRRAQLVWGLLAFIVTATLTHLIAGSFHAGYFGQPGAHLDALWSFLGMLLVGWLSVLIGGCPFRQMIKAGEGDTDAGMVVIGMLAGGGLVQSWGIAATAAGVALNGQVAVLAGLGFVLLLSLLFRERSA
jgi:YedE family putative selenium metabolism protein